MWVRFSLPLYASQIFAHFTKVKGGLSGKQMELSLEGPHRVPNRNCSTLHRNPRHSEFAVIGGIGVCIFLCSLIIQQSGQAEFFLTLGRVLILALYTHRQ